MATKQRKGIFFCLLFVLSCMMLLNVSSACADDTVSVQVFGDDGGEIMVKRVKVPFEKGDTPLSILLKKVDKEKVTVAGGYKSGYVEAINGLCAGKRGPLSGWVYLVNGEQPDVEAGCMKLKPNDDIIWKYVQGLGSSEWTIPQQ